MQQNVQHLELNFFQPLNSLNYKLAYLKVGKNSILNVGHFVAYDGCQIDIADNVELSIGYGSYMNINSTIRCLNKIEIGSNTVISENVMIFLNQFT